MTDWGGCCFVLGLRTEFRRVKRFRFIQAYPTSRVKPIVYIFLPTRSLRESFVRADFALRPIFTRSLSSLPMLSTHIN
jgi:hypothetical protein